MEWLREVDKAANLDMNACINNHQFLMRLGSEMMVWAQNNEDSAKQLGLEFTDAGHLVLQRNIVT